MSSTIFSIGPDNSLTELRHAPYGSEDILQQLLGEHPAVLGSTAGTDDRLLLIARELPVPDDLAGNGRWALDHLFVDQSGVPVLVEVKRASDPRIRREVIAQLLEYAANGAAYFPIEQIAAAFVETWTAREADPDAELREFLRGGDPNAFWRQVEANLRAGHLRLIFVADRIPKELRRIVEFLNEQMRPAEVLALELEQFQAPSGQRTLIPRLIGNTTQAQATKTVGKVLTPVTEQQWLTDLDTRLGTKSGDIARCMVAWFRKRGLEVGVSTAQDSIWTRLTMNNGKFAWPFSIRRSSGKLETNLANLHNYPAYSGDSSRQNILVRLRSLPGVHITTTKANGYPAIPLADFDRQEVRVGFEVIANEIIDRLKSDPVVPSTV